MAGTTNTFSSADNTAAGAGDATAGRPASLVAATVALARRELLRAWRTPATLIQSVVFPALLLLVLLAVFGTAVGEVDGAPYIQRLAPALLIAGSAFGTVGVAMGLFVDRTTGFLDRLRSLPVRPLAPVLARSAGEHLRVLALSVVLVAVAAAFGFRFTAGIAPAAGFFALAVACGGSLGWIGMSLAARASSQEAVTSPLSAIFLVSLFLSQGMVPLDAFPSWVQPVVQVAPASVMIQALQHLSNGGPLVGPVLGALAWAAGITVVFARLTLRRLYGAARSGPPVD